MIDLQDLVTAFHAYLLAEKRCAKNSFLAYRTDISQFLCFLEKKCWSLELVTHEQLVQFLEFLYENKVETRTVSRKISALKLFFDFCSHRYAIKDSAATLQFPKPEKRLPKYLTEEEVQRLLETATKHKTPHGVRDAVMVYTLYVTGMRISELLFLKRSDLNFDENIVMVTGKGNKQRLIPVPEMVMKMILCYLENEHKNLLKGNNSDYLFPVLYQKKVQPISRQSFWNSLNLLCSQAGIQKQVSPHQLRHSFATHLLKQGADLRSLQLLLGHETIATVQIYTHIETSHLRSLYDKKHPRS